MGGAVRTLVRVFSPETIDRRRQEEKAFIDNQTAKLDAIMNQIDECQLERNTIYARLAIITDENGEVIPGNELVYQSLAGSLSTLNIHSNSLIAAQGKLERLVNIYRAYELLKPGDAKDEKVKKRLLANINAELKAKVVDGEKKEDVENDSIDNITESLAEIATNITDSLAETYASTDAVLPPSSIPNDIKRWKQNQEKVLQSKQQPVLVAKTVTRRARSRTPAMASSLREVEEETKGNDVFNDERLRPPSSSSVLSASGLSAIDAPSANTRSRVRRSKAANQEVY